LCFSDRYGRRWLALAFARQGKFEEAISECKKAIELSGRSYRLCLGYVYAKSGETAKSYDILAEDLPINEESKFVRGVIYLLLGDKNAAFQILEKLTQGKAASVLFLKVNPEFDVVRNDSRYRDLIKKIGFPE